MKYISMKRYQKFMKKYFRESGRMNLETCIIKEGYVSLIGKPDYYIWSIKDDLAHIEKTFFGFIPKFKNIPKKDYAIFENMKKRILENLV